VATGAKLPTPIDPPEGLGSIGRDWTL